MLALTDVMLLEQLVQARQVLDDEVAQDPLVCLDTQQGGAEVGGREQVLDDGTHHPEGILLLQEQQEAGGHLARAGGQKASTQVSMRIRRGTLLWGSHHRPHAFLGDGTAIFGSPNLLQDSYLLPHLSSYYLDGGIVHHWEPGGHPGDTPTPFQAVLTMPVPWQ